MNERINNDQLALNEEQFLQLLEKSGDFEIVSCEENFELEDKRHFTKLEVGSAQKMQISALIQHVPSTIAAGTMAQAYVAKFPQGLPHTLTALNQGGYGSMIRADGRFVGSASLYSLSAQAAIMGAFTAMSVVSGQYFLTQINSEMRMMNMKLDEILEFLYGDKKAELMSEMTFVRYAYQNYSSIMTHEQQRIATIVSLQGAKKVAMKDIEFYINNLNSTVSGKPKDYAELRSWMENAFHIKECLELSQQLYVMSNIMEVYFAQNQDSEYLSAVEKDMLAYINKCDKRMLESFGTLKGSISAYKAKPMEKVDNSGDEKRVKDLLDSLNNGEETAVCKAVRCSLNAFSAKTEYYFNYDGNVYIKE